MNSELPAVSIAYMAAEESCDPSRAEIVRAIRTVGRVYRWVGEKVVILVAEILLPSIGPPSVALEIADEKFSVAVPVCPVRKCF